MRTQTGENGIMRQRYQFWEFMRRQGIFISNGRAGVTAHKNTLFCKAKRDSAFVPSMPSLRQMFVRWFSTVR